MASFSCLALANRVYVDNSLFGIVKAYFTKKKNMQYARYQNRSVVIKNCLSQYQVNHIRNVVCDLSDDDDDDCDLMWSRRKHTHNLTSMLTARFLSFKSAGHVKVFPLGAARLFFQQFGAVYTSSVRVAMLMNSNPEPILMRNLRANGFPVPEIIFECGFVMVQSNEGLPLHRYYGSSFVVRLGLAKQILKAAILFTKGINKFR